jgi:hypothetical protein
MSDNTQDKGFELQKQRLLKANNVQRRRYEKMFESVASEARRKASIDLNHQQKVVYNQVVEETLGHDLKELLALRADIQKKKQELEELQKGERVERIRDRLVKRGVKSRIQTGYRDYDPLEFYTNPPAKDEKSEDVCQVIVGNPLVQARLFDFPNNKPYAEYMERARALSEAQDLLHRDIQDVEATIWQVVTTDEIVTTINNFKERWL